MKHKVMLDFVQVSDFINDLNNQGNSEQEIFDFLTSQYDIPRRFNLVKLICEIVNGDLDICEDD